MAELPRGTVTFLFTDVEGSTRLWQAHADTMPDAYARHDAILRNAIAQQGGVVYKTIGDAFQVAFPTAPGAVATSLAAQRALQAEPWPIPEPLKVRMALHTGAVDPGADGDYRSPVLNRLGRLLGAGHGGQVLLSTATAELARGGLPPGTELGDLGEYRLRDLQPERIYQLDGSGLMADFPPLTTVDARPNNLPNQLTPFIGREGELAEAGKLLGRSDVRLLTLTGPGGTGKTRLSLQLAADASDRYPDGVWFVPLAPVTNPALVLSTIAAVLDSHESAGQPLLESLQEALGDKQQLLVLDNFEQVIEAATVVTDLLTASPNLTILVTCRGRLGVYGEQEFPVPPLGMPDPERLPSVTALSQYEAVRLFIARAQAVKPAFTVTNENAPAVAQICVRLDGLPLAIELAAARIRLLTPKAILKRLSDRLALLTGGGRDLPARQQTLRGAIAWSYDLLSAEEQALFRRLAVFAGGATLEAIETVAAANELKLDIFEGLERLADLGLLRQGELEGDPRFDMLETIREYGLEQLDMNGEAAETNQRHATSLLELVEAAAPVLKGGADQRMWITRLEAEHDNLRAALIWTTMHDPVSALRLTGALGNFWLMRGHPHEGQTWVDGALTAGRDAPPLLRLKSLGWAGFLSDMQGDMTVARSRHEEAVALARELGSKSDLAASLSGLGNIAAKEDDLGRAAEFYAESLALCHETGDLYGVAAVSNNSGAVAGQQCDLDRANVLLTESLETARALDDAFSETIALVNLGEVALARRAWTEARALIRLGLETAVAIHAHEGLVAEMLVSMGIAAGHAGQPEAAARLFGAADGLCEAMGSLLDRMLPALYEQAQMEARETLGESAFTAAWGEGRALSLEEAVTEALALAGA